VQVVTDIEVPGCVRPDLPDRWTAAFAVRPHAAAGTAKAAADGWALAEELAAADGDVPAALGAWERRQSRSARGLLARCREIGDSSQFLGTFRPGIRGSSSAVQPGQLAPALTTKEYGMAATIIVRRISSRPDYRGRNLDNGSGNLGVGTRLWFENEHIRVWEVRLMPGERGPFHAHTAAISWDRWWTAWIGRQPRATARMIHASITSATPITPTTRRTNRRSTISRTRGTRRSGSLTVNARLAERGRRTARPRNGPG